MGAHDINLQGYPRSHIKQDWNFTLLCGGKGGGGLTTLQTQTQAVFAIDVNPFTVLNRELTLFNDLVEFYTDSAGAHIAPWWLALSAVSTLTPAQIMAQNNRFDQYTLTGYNIELMRSKLPQPTNAGWANKIYVYIYWGSTSLYGDWVYTNNIHWLQVLKHDFDLRQ